MSQCIEVQNPQAVASYVNQTTGAIISTMPGLGTLLGLAIVGSIYSLKILQALNPKRFGKSEALEIALEEIASELSLSKKQVAENLPSLVLSAKPGEMAENIKNLRV